MKKVITICLVCACILLTTAVGFAVETDPIGGGTGGNSISWYYWSPLTVHETITNLGSSLYRYNYSFVNVDTSPIWGFGVYTNFLTGNVSTFSGHSSWGTGLGPIGSVLPEYDARNLDPGILDIPHTWTMPWIDSPTSIQVGESASGFSFTASIYNTSTKYYLYETIASGYTQTNGTGKVAAVGLTPEPTTICLLGLGALSLIRRKK